MTYLKIIKNKIIQKRKLKTFFFAIILFHLKLASANANSYEEIILSFSNSFEKIIERYNVPGVAIAIVTPTKVLLLKTHGVKELGKSEAINENTIFRIASVSKMITSAVALKLAHLGKLHIDDPIRKYLPDLIICDKAHTNSIQIKHILSHTIGIKAYSLEEKAYSKNSFSGTIHRLSNVKKLAEPGKIFQYQNFSYSIIGSIIEVATKNTFEKNLKIEILQPLNIPNIILSEKEYLLSKNLASPHSAIKNGTKFIPYKGNSYYYNVFPSCGMAFSIKDASRILQALMGGVPSVLNSEILSLIFTPNAFVCKGHYLCTVKKCLCKKNILEYYGLGSRIKKYKNSTICYHTGRLSGYTAWMGFSKEKNIGIIILCNADTKLPIELANCFFRSLFGENNEVKKDFKKFNTGYKCRMLKF